MIAAPGIKFILIGFVLAIACSLWSAYRDSLGFSVAGAILAVLALFLVYFYRNPVRVIPAEPGLILSSADGRVLSIEEIKNDYIGGSGKKVSIFMSVMDPHLNRIPVAGRLDYVKYIPGKFLKAFLDKASEENEHTEIGLEFEGGRIIFKQIAGILARRIECPVKPGQKVTAGEIYGMIHFGSRAEIFLPNNIEVGVKTGDRVKAGVSIIGRLKS
ncbi:MAG: phosphatidylserine decarboxylase family protein [candidate division Zixibacteria bacterium HGW-Zixibacteria-1]|nr:MAG: phosphatidylserine decarboxylase family protein [candidate division Zixibacteria bacterium HGW-Zixibacteria-1]